MSRLRLTKISTPSAPAANYGEIFFSDMLDPEGPAWIDETGVVRRMTSPTVKLTADLGATTSTTLADTTGLVFPVLSGAYYFLRFGIIWTTATGTTGIKIGLTTPTFTIYAGTVRGHVAADATSAEFEGALTTSGDSVALSGAEATATSYLAMVEAMILPSANGSVQVQHAAEVGAAGNVVVKQGSFGMLFLL